MLAGGRQPLRTASSVSRQEKGRPLGRPFQLPAALRRGVTGPAYFPVQVRMTSAEARVPSLNTAVPWAWSLPSGHLALRTPFLLMARLKCVTEPLPPAIFGI